MCWSTVFTEKGKEYLFQQTEVICLSLREPVIFTSVKDLVPFHFWVLETLRFPRRDVTSFFNLPNTIDAWFSTWGTWDFVIAQRSPPWRDNRDDVILRESGCDWWWRPADSSLVVSCRRSWWSDCVPWCSVSLIRANLIPISCVIAYTISVTYLGCFIRIKYQMQAREEGENLRSSWQHAK